MPFSLTELVDGPPQPESTTAVESATLTASMDTSTTTIQFSSATYLGSATKRKKIIIGALGDQEIMWLVSYSGLTGTVIRSASPKAHPSGAKIWAAVDKEMFDRALNPYSVAGDSNPYLDANGALACLAKPSDGVYAISWTAGVPSHLAITTATAQNANLIYAGPATGSPAVPTFRSLVAADIPSLSYGNLSGTLTAGRIPYASGVNSLADDADLTRNGSPAALLAWYASVTNTVAVNITATTSDVEAVMAVGSAITVNPAADATAVSYLGGHYAVSNISTQPVYETSGFTSFVRDSSAQTLGNLYGAWTYAIQDPGAGVVDLGYGFQATLEIHDQIRRAYGVQSLVDLSGTGVVNEIAYGIDSEVQAGATVPAFMHYWASDLAGIATNAYYFWADSRGVYRIREDAVADGAGNPQAITALYNPRFTKYTPGAADYERIVQYWVGNVATYGAEAGGTGTLRALNLVGASVQANGVPIVTTTGSQALSNKTGNISQWTNDASFTTLAAVAGVGYLTSVTAHNLLSATHGDTTAGSVARGDLITGQGASAKWVRLAKGTANQVLAMDGTATDIVWATPAAGGVTSIATTSPISGGTITSTGTISLLVNVDHAFTAGQSITAPAGSSALSLIGGTQTTNFPVLTATQTWNASGVTFTAMKLNVTSTASASGSLLMDWQVGSTSLASITKGGVMAGTFLNGPAFELYQTYAKAQGRDVSGRFINFAANVGGGHTGFAMSSVSKIMWTSGDGSTGDGGNGGLADVMLARTAAGILAMRGTGTTVGGALEWLEQTAPAAGAANTVRLYAVDNGAGKTQLMALFNSGAAQQVAIEP